VQRDDRQVLAQFGGTAVRTTPLVTFNDPDGRTLGDEEIAAVSEVIRSGVLSSTFGTRGRELESAFAERMGVPYAVSCSSGTAALHLAVAALDPEPGDEIITTPISDFGSVIPILMQNAVPVFADVDPQTALLDPEAVRAAITDRTRAILVVHLLGAPAPVAELRRIADEHGLMLIEDCAQAWLTEPEPGRLAGSFGHVGCFSLQQSKHVTAGDGGLVVTGDAALARRMRLFSDKGWPRETGERTYLFLGANYRLSELQAAVALAQLGKLDGVVARRRRQAQRFADAIADLDGVSTAPSGMAHSYWHNPLLLDPALVGTTLDWGAALKAEGIPCSAPYIPRPLYLVPVLAEGRTYGTSRFPLTSPPARIEHHYVEGMCPNAERLLYRTLLALAWNENYSDADVDDIATAVRKVHAVFAAEQAGVSA
jgi:perosamine synthetase